MDLMEGFYQILMREREIPYTAVSTPSGMLWEWLVMSQEMSNAPATFNRCVTNLLRSVREFVPSYFDARPYPGYGWTDGFGSPPTPRPEGSYTDA